MPIMPNGWRTPKTRGRWSCGSGVDRRARHGAAALRVPGHYDRRDDRVGGNMSELYTCKRCGKLTPNFTPYSIEAAKYIGEPGLSYCDDCKRQMTKMWLWENEHSNTDELVCPWCGYVERDSWEISSDSDDEYECPECGKVFEYERNVQVTYTSRRRREDFPGDGSES